MSSDVTEFKEALSLAAKTGKPKKKKKVANSQNIRMNICEARHELALLKEIISVNGWQTEHIRGKTKGC